MHLRGYRGLTLVELLIVVVTMAILMSILFPIAQAAYANARKSACMSNLQQIAQATVAYQQDNLVFPTTPDVSSVQGIPDGGVTALALANAQFSTANLWCLEDPYPEQFSKKMVTDTQMGWLNRDATWSSYNYGYNYYGYVTTSDGLPFPVTTVEAAQYFFGYGRSDWDIGFFNTLTDLFTGDGGAGPFMLKHLAAPDSEQITVTDPVTKITAPLVRNTDYTIDYSSSTITFTAGSLPPSNATIRIAYYSNTTSNRIRGIFQGLFNNRAPQETVITFCPNHPTDKPAFLPMITLAGNALYIKPVRPQPLFAANAYSSPIPASFSVANRQIPNINVINGPATNALRNKFAPIDWRMNKAPLTISGKDQDNTLIADSPTPADTMPLVSVYYRLINVADITKLPGAYPMYDTGIALKAGDVVMTMAHAKWNFQKRALMTDVNYWTGVNPAYGKLFNDAGTLLFSADGDALYKPSSIPLLQKLPSGDPCPMAMLVGVMGAPTLNTADPVDRARYVFSLGSRGFHQVTTTEVPADPQNLFVTMNDTAGNYIDNNGWCELWIAVYSPPV